MHIIVTTPKTEMENAAKEAEEIKKWDGIGYYKHRVSQIPLKLNTNDKIYYVEDGYIRGFAIVVGIFETSFSAWQKTFEIYSDAKSWTWINPIPMKGFQGFRYFDESKYDIQIVGNWLDPKPLVKQEN